MSKIYVQSAVSVWSETGTLTGSDAGIGGSTAGSLAFNAPAYARLVGSIYLSASTQAGSGIQIFQSADGGTNWDVRSACVAAAAGGSGFAYEVLGNAVKIKISNGSSPNTYRANFWLRPV